MTFNAAELHERMFVEATQTKLCLEVGNANGDLGYLARPPHHVDGSL
ncbi:hypothetical protein N9F34_05960 [Alphaproteobacteria bacterium]|nr:hypothetical protein [Alphaproteobacteria bacterium]